MAANNAAFFAGLELVAHTPHSFYIDRYPMGGEATVSWGGPELIFRNDWSAPLRMRLHATATALTVTFYSALLGRRVETTTGEPYDFTQPSTVVVMNPTLAPAPRLSSRKPASPVSRSSTPAGSTERGSWYGTSASVPSTSRGTRSSR